MNYSQTCTHFSKNFSKEEEIDSWFSPPAFLYYLLSLFHDRKKCLDYYSPPLLWELNPASHFALIKMVAVFEVICIFGMYIKTPVWDTYTNIPYRDLILVFTYFIFIKKNIGFSFQQNNPSDSEGQKPPMGFLTPAKVQVYRNLFEFMSQSSSQNNL